MGGPKKKADVGHSVLAMLEKSLRLAHRLKIGPEINKKNVVALHSHTPPSFLSAYGFSLFCHANFVMSNKLKQAYHEEQKNA